ncbi:MAG: hypothetical protein ACN0LA_00075 [Candidatus Longimicrobiales bacterium M2_2A_002]
MTLLAGALTIATSAAAQERPGTTKDAPRFANVWIGGPLDSIYSAEYARLQETCENVDTACFAAELDTTAVVLGPVWSSPDGDTVGHLAAALRPRGRYPYATLLYRPTQGPDVVVREDLGDWGYGVTLPLADRAEGWVRLRVPDADPPLWLPADIERRGFGVVDVYGLSGRLWRLGPAVGTDAGGGDATVPAGVYFVLEVADGTVRLRPEVPSDMPCGGEPRPAPASVPEFAVPLDALTRPDGRLAVEPAYPKGC